MRGILILIAMLITRKIEIKRVQSLINQQGTINICIIGLGMNGHIALNEPADFLEAYYHIADLSEKSCEHTMLDTIFPKLRKGLTLGMVDILQAKTIVMIINAG
jgi:galactosamine-6-phosphate isomerase